METATQNATIEQTLSERGSRYGAFTDHAAIAQGLKAVVYARPGWPALKPDAKQAVEVIFDKIARMVNGQPEYDDNWRDIVGYGTLVLNRILAEPDPAQTTLALPTPPKRERCCHKTVLARCPDCPYMEDTRRQGVGGEDLQD